MAWICSKYISPSWLLLFAFCENLHHHVLKTLRRESGILWQIISDKVALEGHKEGEMIYMSREQTPSKGGDKQTWPRKAPCSPSALAFFAPSLQIKSGIPRLGLSYPRSYHCINFTPHHSFRECKKQLLKPNIVSDSPKRGLSILIVWGFLTYLWQNLCCILLGHIIQEAYCNCNNMWSHVMLLC